MATRKTNFDSYLEEQLRDPGFAARFRDASRRWDVALQIAEHRTRAGLTQSELARRAKTTQQQVSRIESPNYRGSLRLLDRVAKVLEMDVQVRLVPSVKKRAPKKPAAGRAEAGRTVAARAQSALTRKK